MLAVVTFYILFSQRDQNMSFLFISDACIKEELDAVINVKIKLDVNPFIIKEDLDNAGFDNKIEPAVSPLHMKGFNEPLIAKKGTKIIGSNDSKEEITIKEEPLQDDLVS